MSSTPDPSPVTPQRSTLWVLLSALAISSIVTYAVWHFATSRDTAEARVSFEARASQVEILIRERMRDYEQALLGMSTIFAAGTPVSNARWLAQFDLLRLTENYPGFQGIGYASRIAGEEKARHEAALRKDEFPNYAVRPEGERPFYTPVIYLAPANERHRRVIGFDMYNEPLRRAAMDAARDKGQAVITRKITLAQEQKDDMQPGFLMYIPVYRRDAAIAAAADRRDAIQGYVFSSFRSSDLAENMFARKSDIRIEIFDGTQQPASALLYDSAAKSAPITPHAPLFSVFSTIAHYGGAWSVRVSTRPEFESSIDHTGARFASAGAFLICLLALTMIWSQLTLRRRAESLAANITRDLTLSREQLELALDGSDLALFDWNISTGDVQLSARWNQMLGGKAEPVRTTLKALQELVPPEDQAVVARKIKDLVTGHSERYDTEHRIRRHDGTTIWIASHAKVGERDSLKRALRLVGTHRDITQRREMDRMKSEFISNVSHELRTPITALIGALGLLRKGAVGPMPDKAVTFLDMAYQNSERLSALVNDILTLEDNSSGRVAFNITSIELAPFLERAVSMNTSLADKKRIQFALEPAARTLHIRADSERLMQVVTNLLSNAVKFSPENATVTLAAEARGALTRVSVIDQGAGIPLEFRPRIFERFMQADGSSTRSQGGSGLGLAVCKTLIEGMGGQIGYTSETGQGTTFYFELPSAGDAAPDTQS